METIENIFEIKEEERVVIKEKHVEVDVEKLKPGYYQLYFTEDGERHGLMLEFVKNTNTYGGANYIILKSRWVGSSEQGSNVVDCKELSYRNLNDEISRLYKQHDFNLELVKI